MEAELSQSLLEYSFESFDAGVDQRATVQERFVTLLESRTQAWRHALARIAMRSVDSAPFYEAAEIRHSAAELLWSDALGVLAIDSGLVVLADEAARRGTLTDSVMDALQVLTEPAPFGSNPRLSNVLVGPRALQCVLAQQAGRARWSDTVRSFVGHLVPSLLIMLETSDPTWRTDDSDSAIGRWPDGEARGAMAERLAGLRASTERWRGGPRSRRER
jgi:hypothetical protein